MRRREPYIREKAMKGMEDSGTALAMKLALGLLFALIAIFFVVQVSIGARVGGGLPEPRGEEGDRSLGEALYLSLEELLGALSDLRSYTLDAAWELAVGGELFVDEEGGFLYLTSSLGRVMAVDAASGSTVWSLDLGAWVSAPPTARAGVVYVGATDHVLYALDAGSGALLWYYTAQGEILAQPVVSGGMVFFTADNDSVYDLVHRLYALDARSGAPIWVYDTESWTPSPPAVGEEAVYLGGYRREVYALDKSTGRELWSFKASNIVFSSPQTASGRVLFSCIDGWVHALEEGSGVPVWSRKLPGFVWLAPLDGSGRLYACSHRNTLTAMALETGEELWTFADGEFLSCSTLVDTETICAFGAEGRVYLLDSATGSSNGIVTAPYDFASPPLLVGRKVYASSSDGFFRAYMFPPDMMP
jgi:eukaryotic-like serine/threonine-protein kinase